MATLSFIITRVRGKLDDKVASSYLWPSTELTFSANRLINSLCREIPLLTDGTTASVCNISFSANDTVKSSSARILHIMRAKFASQTKPIPRVTKAYMDGRYPDWENADAGEPSKLIVSGVGTDKLRVYPKCDTSYELWLDVSRLPLVDLDWEADQANTPEIPERYHDLLIHGICWQALMDQDADTRDKKASAEFFSLWEMDKEEIKKAETYKRHVPGDTVRPLTGMT